MAEDEPLLLESLVEALQGWGYEVLAAPTLSRLLLALEHFDFCAAVLDIVFANEGVVDIWGLPLAYPQTKFIFITGYYAPLQQSNIPLPENATVLRKPFSLKRLKLLLGGSPC